MFNRYSRYVTRGINEGIYIRLQFIMCSMIDKLKGKGIIKLDYLQIFNKRKQGSKVIIEHSQEVPEHKDLYSIDLEGLDLNEEIRVYIVDSGDYLTMLLPCEY